MPSENMMESTISHLIRPKDLNHHGTMFAGQMAKWLVEAGLIAASWLTGKPEDIVCVQLNGMTFKNRLTTVTLLRLNQW